MTLRMTDTLHEDEIKYIKFQDSVNTWNSIIQNCTNTNDGINKPQIIEQPFLDYVPQIINQCVYHHTKHSNVSPMFILMQMLGTMNCVNRGYFIVHNGSFKIPANAFIIQAADSGYGKSRLNKKFKKSILQFQMKYNESIKFDLIREEHERKRILSEIKETECEYITSSDNHEREKLITTIDDLKREYDNLKLHELEIFADDITIPMLMELMHKQRDRIAIMNSELGILLHLITAKSNSNYCEKFLRLFNGDDIKFDRRSGEKVIMLNPILALYILTQIESLRDLISNKYITDSGITSRMFISIADDRNIGFRNFENTETDPCIQNKYDTTIEKVLHRIQTSSTSNEVLFFDHYAKQEFSETRYRIEASIRPGGDLSSISEWAKKICNHISTIAALLHLHEYPTGNNTIPHKTLKTAINITFWLAQNMISFNNFAFPTRSNDFPFIIAKKIYDKQIQSFTARDITRLFSNISTDDVRYALSALINFGGIYILPRKTIVGPGRPNGDVYITNPNALVDIINKHYYR